MHLQHGIYMYMVRGATPSRAKLRDAARDAQPEARAYAGPRANPREIPSMPGTGKSTPYEYQA